MKYLIKQTYYLILFLSNFFLFVIPIPFLRVLFLNVIGQKISWSAAIHRIKLKSLKPKSLIIGKRSIINNNVVLDNREKIIIGNDVSIAEYSKIYTNFHDNLKINRPILKKKVIIQDKVFIYSSVIINPGVTICEGTFIGAGSVVTKDTEGFSFYAGNPAVMKRKLSKVDYKNNFFGYGFTP